MQIQIKKVRPKSLGKVFGLLCAILGFIGGLLFFIFTLVTWAQSETSSVGELLYDGEFLFGIEAPMLFPLTYGTIGYIMGFVGAWLYNIIAKKIGGVEIEAEQLV